MTGHTYVTLRWKTHDGFNDVSLIVQLKTITKKNGYKFYSRYTKINEDDYNEILIGLYSFSWFAQYQIEDCVELLWPTFKVNGVEVFCVFRNVF